MMAFSSLLQKQALAHRSHHPATSSLGLGFQQWFPEPVVWNITIPCKKNLQISIGDQIMDVDFSYPRAWNGANFLHGKNAHILVSIVVNKLQKERKSSTPEARHAGREGNPATLWPHQFGAPPARLAAAQSALSQLPRSNPSLTLANCTRENSAHLPPCLTRFRVSSLESKVSSLEHSEENSKKWRTGFSRLDLVVLLQKQTRSACMFFVKSPH